MHKPCRINFTLLVSCLLLACYDPQGSTTGPGPIDKDAGDAGLEAPATGVANDLEETRLDDYKERGGETEGGWQVPVAGVNADDLRSNWGDPRSGGRRHAGLDILAPAGTAVLAAGDGVIRKLFVSERGGLTIYQAVDGHDYQFYYAHLQRYVPDIAEGQWVSAGTVIAFVGTSGNAPDDVPHLHFEVHEMAGTEDWWKGRAIDPVEFLNNDLERPR